MRLLAAAIVVVLWFVLPGPASAARQASEADGVGALISTLHEIVLKGDPDRYSALLASESDAEEAARFAADLVRPGAARAVIRERDRSALPGRAAGEGYRLLLEVFIETGDTARVTTLRLDVVRGQAVPDNAGPAWQIVDQERLSNLEGLHRLRLSTDKQFKADGLSLVDEDFTLTIVDGSAFVAETRDGTTGLVIIGDGRIRFAPPAAAERGQVQIFSGSGVLDSPIEGVFVRVHPADLKRRLVSGGLEPRPLDVRDLTRAQQVFSEESTRSFTLDLGDLSPEPWSLVPSYGDLVVEARTRKFGTLTYARSNSEPEDISLFDRKRRRNISVYSSARRLEQRGPFFSDDDESDYDVQHYDIEASFDPVREWMEGRVEMRVRIRVPMTSSLTIRLAEPLTAHAVVSDLHGRLLSLRVRGQNSLVVNLPEAVEKDTEFTIAVVYSGRLPPLSPEREVIAPGEPREPGQPPPGLITEEPVFRPELKYVYSTRSHWYPQSPVNDYATATMKLTVPDVFDCVASGSPSSANPVRIPPRRPGVPGGKQFVFVVGQPLRYFAWVISRFELAVAAAVTVARTSDDPAGSSLARGAVYDGLDLAIVGNPRQVARGRTLEAPVRGILAYFAGVLQDVPFPNFTLAVVDSDLPGGHSPGYFALLNQPLPTTQYTWRNDPVAFEGFPQFFLAHELAHQFWGQAVGWRNYHEQWLSEGLAQYFALLYAEQVRGQAGARGLLRQMRRSVMEYADEGPISLGYRLGHLKGDSRIFRAVVYNKSALVLNMLRRLVGDEVFFRGLREFYWEWRFDKAGTDDFRRTFERVAGRSLERFFDRWVSDSRIPALRFTYDVVPPEATGPGAGSSTPQVRLVFEQQGDVFEVPVVVTLRYGSGQTEDVQVNVTDARTEQRVPLKGTLRSADANADQTSLVFINGR